MNEGGNKNVISFTDAAKRRTGALDPKDLFEQALASAEDLDTVVIIGLTKDGEIASGWTTTALLEVVGLLEAAKNHVLDQVYQWE